LTATLCYANDQTSASPHAAAPCHVDGQVAGISSPNTAPHIESCAIGKGDRASPGFDAAAMTHQQEVDQLRTHFQKIEADQLKHIEGLQVGDAKFLLNFSGALTGNLRTEWRRGRKAEISSWSPQSWLLLIRPLSFLLAGRPDVGK